MAIAQYLIDTNARIDYLGEALPINGMAFMDQIIDNGYNLSIISRIELYSYSKLSDSDKAILDIFTAHSSLLNINDEIIEQTIELRRIYKTKLPDAIIAATAIVHNFTLITHNIRDFKDIQNLSIIDPHTVKPF
jgi:predicted nucleic acid-binding protein